MKNSYFQGSFKKHLEINLWALSNTIKWKPFLSFFYTLDNEFPTLWYTASPENVSLGFLGGASHIIHIIGSKQSWKCRAGGALPLRVKTVQPNHFNPVNPNIIMNILHNVPYSSPEVLTGIICLTIKSFFG